MKNKEYFDVPKRENYNIFIKIVMYAYILFMVISVANYILKFCNVTEFGPSTLMILILLCSFSVLMILLSLTQIKKTKNQSDVKYADVIMNLDSFQAVPEFEQFDPFKIVEEEKEVEEEDEVQQVIVSENLIEEIEMSFETMCNNFILFARSKGIDFDKDTAMAFLSNLSSSRFIFVHYNELDILNKFIDVASEFFNANKCSIDMKEVNNLNELLYSEYSYSSYSNNLLKCNTNKQMTFNIFSNVDLNSFGEKFTHLVNYSNNYNDEFVFEIQNVNSADSKIEISFDKKVYNFIVLNKEEKLFDCPSLYTSFSSFFTPRNLRYIAEEKIDIKLENITYNCFEDLVRDCLEEKFVEEKTWKKVDELENVLAADKICFSNKNWNQFEKYTSVYLSAGGQEEDAMDNLLVSKIIPFMNSVKKEYEESSLYLIIESNFGSENILRSNELLKKIKK